MYILLCEYLGYHIASSFISLRYFYYYKTHKIYVHTFIMQLNFNCTSVLNFIPYNMNDVSVLYTVQIQVLPSEYCWYV